MARDPILAGALNLLEAAPGLAKIRAEGAPVTSSNSGPSLIDDAVLEALRQGDDLDEQAQRALIWALDLLAAGLPDQHAYPLDPEVQRIAGKLRERFSRAYKHSAYAGLRAT